MLQSNDMAVTRGSLLTKYMLQCGSKLNGGLAEHATLSMVIPWRAHPKATRDRTNSDHTNAAMFGKRLSIILGKSFLSDPSLDLELILL
jgi:hypothetical protein